VLLAVPDASADVGMLLVAVPVRFVAFVALVAVVALVALVAVVALVALVAVAAFPVMEIPQVPEASPPVRVGTSSAVRAPACVVEFVPPLAIGKVPVTPVVRLTLLIVLFDPLMVLFVSVCVPDTLTAVAPPRVAAAGKVAVPVTLSVFPEPTFRPTEVPVPSALKTPSTVSKLVLIFVPHVSVDAPTSGFTRLRFVVFVSAIALPL